MTDETKEIAEETNEESEETPVVEETQSEEVDYKAELEKARSEAERLTKITRQQAGALREERKLRKQEKPQEQNDEPSKMQLDSVIEAKLDAIERRRFEDDLADQLELLISDTAERDLVAHHYENSLRPSGFSRRAIKEDIMKARLLANQSRYQSSIEKKVRKDIAETEAIKSASGSVRSKVDEEPKSKQRLTKEERRFLKIYGVKTE